MEHPLWARLPVLEYLSRLRIPSPGGNDTVDRAAMRFADVTHPFAAVHGAGFRGVYDLSDLTASRFALAAGQSGHFWSHHYRDMTPVWRAGEGLRLTGAPDELRRAGAERLRLMPSDTTPPH